MTLDNLVNNNSYENTKNFALIFNDQIKDIIIDANNQYGNIYFNMDFRKLNDNKWMISADILSEIKEGGLFYNVWQFLDYDTLNDGITVISMEEASGLLQLSGDIGYG